MFSGKLFGELEVEIVNSMLLSEISYDLFVESFSVHLCFNKCTFYSFVGTVNIQDTDVQKNPFSSSVFLVISSKFLTTAVVLVLFLNGEG